MANPLQPDHLLLAHSDHDFYASAKEMDITRLGEASKYIQQELMSAERDITRLQTKAELATNRLEVLRLQLKDRLERMLREITK